MDLFCSLESRKIKSMGALNGAYVHNETIEGRSKAPNVNPDSHFYSLLDSNLSYTEKWYERIADVEVETQRKIKPRKDAVYALEWIAGIPKEAIGVVNIDEWARLTKEWLFSQVNKKNVIGFSVHLDEGSPHIHMTFMPINEEGRLNNKNFVGGPGKLHWLQSNYAKSVESLGLKRGIINSKSKHSDIQRLYNCLNKTLDNKLPDKLLEESDEEYKKRIDDIYTESNLQVLKLKTDIGREIKSGVALKQRYHIGINFQNKVKEIFKDDADTVLSSVDGLTNEELFNLLNDFLLKNKKKTEEISIESVQKNEER